MMLGFFYRMGRVGTVLPNYRWGIYVDYSWLLNKRQLSVLIHPQLCGDVWKSWHRSDALPNGLAWVDWGPTIRLRLNPLFCGLRQFSPMLYRLQLPQTQRWRVLILYEQFCSRQVFCSLHSIFEQGSPDLDFCAFWYVPSSLLECWDLHEAVHEIGHLVGVLLGDDFHKLPNLLLFCLDKFYELIHLQLSAVSEVA